MSAGEGHHSEFEGLDYKTIDDDLVQNITKTGRGYWIAVGITGIITILGAILYYYQTTVGLGVWGTNEPVYWGLDMPSFIFWIGFSLSGTLLSAMLMLTKSHWRNPIYRAAEISTGLALLVAMVTITTHMGRPWRAWYSMPLPNFRFLWPNFRSPLQLDIIGMIAYLTASLTFLYVGAIPDFAALRTRVSGWRKKLYGVLSLGWQGTASQWRHYRRAYLLIAIFIIPVAISMHTVTSWVPSMTNNPMSRSTVYPLYFVTGALLSGVSGVIMILTVIRKFTNLSKYLKLKYFDHLAKLVLVASIGISYIYLIELFIPWYKPFNFELMPLAAKLYGRYSYIFWPMVFFNSVFPLLMFFRKVRRNPAILFVIAIGIQVAMYFERLLMVTPALSIGYLPSQWISYTPNWFELALTAWEINIFIFLYLLISKIIPVVSIFEVKELLPFPKRTKAVKATPQAALSTDGPLIRGGSNGNPLLGVFEFADDTIKTIKDLKEAGFKEIEAHSPVPNGEIIDLLEPKQEKFSLSPRYLLNKIKNRDIQVIRFSAAGAIGGVVVGVLLSVGTMLLYPIKTGPFSIVPLPQVVYMAGVVGSLLGLVVTAGSVIFLGKLPTSIKSKTFDEAATTDRFAVIVSDANTKGISSVKKIFENYGAERIIEGAASK